MRRHFVGIRGRIGVCVACLNARSEHDLVDGLLESFDLLSMTGTPAMESSTWCRLYDSSCGSEESGDADCQTYQKLAAGDGLECHET